MNLPQPTAAKPPIPVWVWGVWVGLAGFALLALALAWVLGTPAVILTPAQQPATLQPSAFEPTYGPTEIEFPFAEPSATLIISTSAAVIPTAPSITSAPSTPSATQPATWVPVSATVARTKPLPKLAIVIDDMALVPHLSAQIMALNQPFSLAFIPYAPQALAMATTAKAQGYELLIHVPMQPLPHINAQTGRQYVAGPNTLETTDTPEQLAVKIETNIAELAPLAVGVNNHMGSAFTRHTAGMAQLLTALQTRGLMFLDSKTTSGTATKAAAQAAGVSIPLLARDVFLDDTPTPEAIEAQLKKAIALAQKNGQAIAIGHPLPSTIQVLREQLTARTSGTVQLVPLTALIQR